MKLTFKVLAIVAALVSAPAFAYDGTADLSTTFDVNADAGAATMTAVAGAGVTSAFAGSNVALIEQLSTAAGDVAVIDQSTATSADNYAAISQQSANPSVAYITQQGGTSFAFIKQ